MSDDVVVTSGSYTDTIAADDLAGKKAQRVKIVWGVDGSGTDASASAPFPVVQTGALAVTTLPALPAGANAIGSVTVTALPAIPAGANVMGGVTQSGTWSVRTQDGAGTALTSTGAALDVNVKTSAVGSTVGTENGTIASGHTSVAEVMAMPYTFTGDAGHTRAGATPYQSNDVDETPEQVKATAGIVYGFHWYNRHATLERYLKWYNHAAPTVGTTPTAFYTPMKPATEGHLWVGPPGIGFTTAISVAAVTGWLDTDAGAPGANEVMLTVFRK